jgi:UDP-glucose 4-epimerase
VVVVARTPPAGERAVALDGCELVLGDVEAGSALELALEGVDHVVHAVGHSLPAESNADPISDATTSLVSILRTLEALKRRPEVRLLYLSSGGAIYGNVAEMPISESAECLPISSYGVMKLAAEKYLAMYQALYGIASISLRISNAYGPGQPVRASQGFVAACLDAVRSGHALHLYGGGENVRDYIFIDDIVGAVVGLSARPEVPTTVNIGSCSGYSLLDVLGLVEKVTGTQLEIEHAPGRSVDVSSIVLSTQRLQSLVPWGPIGLEEGLRRTWEHAQQASVILGGTS